MLRNDGEYTFYVIQHQLTQGGWNYSSLDHFGTPPGFRDDKCRDQTGVRGVFNVMVAIAGLEWIRKKHTDHIFRLVKVITSQQTMVMEAF